MDQLNVPSRPLCVDLDGTLVETDTMNYLIVSLVRKNFLKALAMPFWLRRGRAYFKRRLAEEADLAVGKLPIHAEFLKFLEQQHAAGRTLVLVSASDEKVVRVVVEKFKIFSRGIGSDGKANLRGAAKVKYLTELYGAKGFDYAGNSSVDYPVWEGSAQSIVVNARPEVERRAREIGNVFAVFPPRTSRWKLLRQAICQ